MNKAHDNTFTKHRPGFLLRACRRCGGDAFPDLADGGWRCLQCARPLAEDGSVYTVAEVTLADDDEPTVRRRAA
jgi:hypothetical protein